MTQAVSWEARGEACEGGGVYSYQAWPQSYDHGPSHSYNAGTEYVGFSPTRQTLGGGEGVRCSVLLRKIIPVVSFSQEV